LIPAVFKIRHSAKPQPLQASLKRLFSMKIIFSIFVSLFTSNSFGQKFVFDTTANSMQFDKMDYYYSKTDFSIIDTLKLWNYQLDTNTTNIIKDSINPIGQLYFWRTVPIYDSISKIVYNRLWSPHITFDIYAIEQLSYCYQTTSRARFLSSCVPPNVGGDLIIIDKFVFVSRGVCLDCSMLDTKVDYCRPVINYLFSNLDITQITTIQSLVKQFAIDEGKL